MKKLPPNRSLWTFVVVPFGILVAMAWGCFLVYPDLALRLAPMPDGSEYLGREGVVMQTTRMNCGPSALKMILDGHGVRIPLDELESIIPVSEDGASMLALKNAAVQFGLETDGWRLVFDDLRTGPLPAVVFVDRSHFVVIDSIRHHTVFLRDPGIGRMAVPEARFKERWKGETLLFR